MVKPCKDLTMEFIKVFTLLVVLACLVAFGFYMYVTIPYVHKSWTTKSCLFIEYSDGSKGTCKELPSRYEVVWHK